MNFFFERRYLADALVILINSASFNSDLVVMCLGIKLLEMVS